MKPRNEGRFKETRRPREGGGERGIEKSTASTGWGGAKTRGWSPSRGSDDRKDNPECREDERHVEEREGERPALDVKKARRRMRSGAQGGTGKTNWGRTEDS